MLSTRNIAAIVALVAFFATSINVFAQESFELFPGKTVTLLKDSVAEAIQAERRAYNNAHMVNLKRMYADVGYLHDGNVVGDGAIIGKAKIKAYQGISVGLGVSGELYAENIAPMAVVSGVYGYRKMMLELGFGVAPGTQDKNSASQEKFLERNYYGKLMREVWKSNDLQTLVYIGGYLWIKDRKDKQVLSADNYDFQRNVYAQCVGGGLAMRLVFSREWKRDYHALDIYAGFNQNFRGVKKTTDLSAVVGGRKNCLQLGVGYKWYFALGGSHRTAYNESLPLTHKQIDSLILEK